MGVRRRLYREGKLLLDETVTHEYKLAEVNEGYEDMRAGRNIRGVILHDHQPPERYSRIGFQRFHRLEYRSGGEVRGAR